MQDPTEKRRRYDQLRDEGKSHEEAVSLIESAPSPAAPVDRLDQTIRNPEGQDPLAKYGPTAIKYGASLAGGGVGALGGRALATKVAGAAGRKIAGRMGIGAAAGLTGGAAARATGNTLSGRNPVEGLLEPASLAIDAGLGAAIPVAGAVLGKAKEFWGKSPNITRAKTLEKVLTEAPNRMGKTPQQLEDLIRSKNPLPHQAVMDLDPALQGVAATASQKAPLAERALQEFADARKGAPLQGMLSDVQNAVGKAADVASTAKRMRAAIKYNDKIRFEPLWKQYPDPIVEPKTMRQVQAIFKEISGAKGGLISDQNIALKPVKELLQKVTVPGQTQVVQSGRHSVPIIGAKAKKVDAVTLKGLHRLKIRLDKAISAGDKAEQAGTITGDAAVHLGALKTARSQLMELPLEGVKGADEFKAALAESSRERAVVGALKDGAKAVAGKVSPRESKTALEAISDPQAQRAYRRGLTGKIRQKTLETGSTTPLTKNQNLAQKIADAARDPSKLAAREARLPEWQAMEATNKAQGAIKPPTFSLSGEAGPAGDIAGNLGASQAAGAAVTADPQTLFSALRLLVGNTLFRGAKGRVAASQVRAWEDLAPLLKATPGPEAADLYRKLLREFGDLKRAQTVKSGIRAGGAVGAFAGMREP